MCDDLPNMDGDALSRRRLLRMGSGVSLAAVGGCLRLQTDEQNGGEEGTTTAQATDAANATSGDDAGAETATGEAVSPTVRQFQNDAANTGFDAELTGPYDPVDEQWSMAGGRTAPAIVGDRLFATNGADVVAVDRTDGSEHWRLDFSADSHLAVADGEVYVSSSLFVSALDAETGDIVWRKGIEDEHTAATMTGDTLYYGKSTFNDNEGAVVARDRSTGEARWDTDIESPVKSPPAVADGTVLVRAGESDGPDVYALQADRGNIMWSEATPQAGTTAPAVADGHLLVASDDLYALDVDTGDQLWTAGVEAVGTSPVVANGVVYVGAGSDLVAVDLQSGEEQWRYTDDTPDRITGDPAIAGDTVYFGDNHGIVYGVAADEPTERFSTGGGSSDISVSIVVADGQLYAAGRDLVAYEDQ